MHKPKTFKAMILRGLSQPKKAFEYINGLLIGSLYILFYRLFKPNIKIKFPFFVHEGVKIMGPGNVKIERNCSVIPSLMEGLTIVTFSDDTNVYIGENSQIGGLTIRCAENVEVGSNALIANCLIQDFLFFSNFIKEFRKGGNDFSNCTPVKVRPNVWLGLRTAVLKGSNIGAGCVLAAGAVCYEQAVKDGSLCMGNLVVRPLSIESVLKFK